MATHLEDYKAISPAPQASSTGQVRLPSWWLLAPLILLPAVLGVVLLYYYRQQFPEPFAPTQEVWGQFGDFIGGALNPFIAWVSLIAIAVSLRYTVKAIQLSVDAVDAASRQAVIAQKHFEHEVAEQKKRRAREISAEKAERTFQLFQTWISPEMQALRTEVWEFLNTTIWKKDESFRKDHHATPPSSELQSSSNGPHAEPAGDLNAPCVFIGRFRKSGQIEDRRMYYSVGTISHFMADVHALIELELLDPTLFLNLLGRSLTQWCDLYHRLDFRVASDDTSSISNEENNWHREAVRGLATLLNQYRATVSVARQFGMPGPGAATDPASDIGSGS